MVTIDFDLGFILVGIDSKRFTLMFILHRLQSVFRVTLLINAHPICLMYGIMSERYDLLIITHSQSLIVGYR